MHKYPYKYPVQELELERHVSVASDISLLLVELYVIVAET